MKRTTLAQGIAGIVSLILYVFTMAPGVTVGDSGEFITNAFILGINHTTGYPLYTLLGRFAVLITPFLSPALAVNVVSALAASAGIVFLARILLALGFPDWSAAAASLVLGVSVTFWSRATIAEVYMLSALALLIVLDLSIRWDNAGRTDVRQAYLIAFLSGLGLMQHVTGVVVLPVIAVFVLSAPSIREGRRWLQLVLFFTIGASVYLYLPVRSSVDPPIDWLDPDSPLKLLNFFFPYVGRKVFGMPLPAFGDRFMWIGEQLLTKEFWYFAALGVFGVAAMWSRKRVALLLLVIAALNIVYCALRRQPTYGDLDASLVPAIVVMAIFMAAGVHDLLSREERTSGFMEPGAFAALVIVCGSLNLGVCDRSSDTMAPALSEDLLASIEPNSILFVLGDEQLFLPWYEKFVAKKYPGMTIVNREIIATDWHAKAVGKELGMNLLTLQSPEERCRLIIQNFEGRRPLAFTNEIPWDWVYRDHATSRKGLSFVLDDTSGGTPCAEPTFAMERLRYSDLDDRSVLAMSYYPKTILRNAARLATLGRIDESACLLRAKLSFLPEPQLSEYRAAVDSLSSALSQLRTPSVSRESRAK